MSLQSGTPALANVSLHRRLVFGAGVGGALVILALAATASVLLKRDIAQGGDARVAEAADRASIVMESALEARARQATVLALSPEVVAAAREGSARARKLGLVGQPITHLEQRFNATQSLLVAPSTRLLGTPPADRLMETSIPVRL